MDKGKECNYVISTGEFYIRNYFPSHRKPRMNVWLLK